MKLSELIRQLQLYSGDMEVVTVDEYGFVHEIHALDASMYGNHNAEPIECVVICQELDGNLGAELGRDDDPLGTHHGRNE